MRWLWFADRHQNAAKGRRTKPSQSITEYEIVAPNLLFTTSRNESASARSIDKAESYQETATASQLEQQTP